MIISELKKNKVFSIFLLTILVLAFATSMVFCFIEKVERRHTFIFPSVEKGEYIIESRFLPKTNKSSMEFFIDELLLGPQTERCQYVFAKDTMLNSFIFNNGIVYVDLSDHALYPADNQISIKNSCELLEKNLHNNFPSVKEVKIFINGNQVFTY